MREFKGTFGILNVDVRTRFVAKPETNGLKPKMPKTMNL